MEVVRARTEPGASISAGCRGQRAVVQTLEQRYICGTFFALVPSLD